jgi:hypothetical protein
VQHRQLRALGVGERLREAVAQRRGQRPDTAQSGILPSL